VKKSGRERFRTGEDSRGDGAACGMAKIILFLLSRKTIAHSGSEVSGSAGAVRIDAPRQGIAGKVRAPAGEAWRRSGLAVMAVVNLLPVMIAVVPCAA
jgi:hypothetical protein